MLDGVREGGGARVEEVEDEVVAAEGERPRDDPGCKELARWAWTSLAIGTFSWLAIYM
jgi:hypothetical protein